MTDLIDSLPPIPYWIALEWINVSLEYTAVCWVKLPRLFLAVLAVNLATHPAFMVFLPRFHGNFLRVLAAEMVIWLVEGIVLAIIYRRKAGIPFLFFMAFLMNTVSYGTGLLLEM